MGLFGIFITFLVYFDTALEIDLSDFGSFDLKHLSKYLDPRAANDLNDFLENLPQNVGKVVLTAAGIAWLCAAGSGVLALAETQKAISIKKDLQEKVVLKPPVPKIKSVSVDKDTLTKFVERASSIYSNVDIKVAGSDITLSSGDTRNFPEFREAFGHVLNGGDGWRVEVRKMCVGRECDKSKLYAVLTISKLQLSGV